MSFRRANKAVLMADWETPVKEMIERLEPFMDQIEINGEDYMIAIFEHEGKSKGNIILPIGYGKENQNQGIAGMILKAGPLVHLQDHRFKDGQAPKVGDWIMFKGTDTVPFLFGDAGYMCRLIEAAHIRAILKRPDVVL